MKRLAILGSTGSIGRQTLEIVRALPDEFQVVGLAAGKNLELLRRQVEEFHPRFVANMLDFPDDKIKSISPEALARNPDIDILVVATSGKAGLKPTLSALEAGKTVALANKEVLVMAGEMVTALARAKHAVILPMDSEHSAIWQCLDQQNQQVARIILTASGGPFYRRPRPELEKVTVEQALKHPSWQMGKKVTIDSATLMNKGLEIIEAHWLFGLPFAAIEVIIHPQSIIHSMVEFVDGSIKAQMSYPDMRLPIQYALSYPERLANAQLPRLDFLTLHQLTFEQPDYDKFPCLKMAIAAGKQGGTYPAALCGADEAVVELFLSRQIKFVDIAPLVQRVLDCHKAINRPTLNEIFNADDWARKSISQMAEGGPACC